MAMSQRMWRREQERKRRERERRARRRRNCTLIVMLIAAGAAAAVCLKYCAGGGETQSGADRNTAAEATVQPSAAAAAPSAPAGTPIPVSELETSFYRESAFVGNALADGIEAYGILPDTDIYAKVGIDLDNAYTTAADNDSMSVVDQLKSKNFSKVFLFFGESELASNDASGFEDKYAELIGKVKSYQQEARIYVVSIPPVTKETSESSASGMTVRNIRSYNNALRRLAADEEVYYADAYEALADDDGYLKSGVSADGINLDRDSYIIMLNYIADNAYIPDSSDNSGSSEEDTDGEEENTEDPDSSGDEDEDTEPTSRPRPTAESERDSGGEEEEPTATPRPTVNVLKDSAVSGSSGGDSE